MQVSTTVEQILEALPHLSFGDRLKIAAAAYDSLQDERERFKAERSKRLALSALKMQQEYETNPELTLVTALAGRNNMTMLSGW